jgi:hypothetical protein
LYHYWAYGLIVASEMKFPELFPLEDEVKASVVLALGEVPKPEIHPGGFHFENIEITPSEYRLNVEGIAHYYVANGNRITIKPFEGASEDLVRLYCLSNAFAALLHQRRTIPLHCAALLKNDRLIMIFGESGAGKSTTMAGLLQKGFSPFSDDVCVPVKDISGDWAFYSSYPMMKFWQSTIDIKGLELQPERKIRNDMDKFGIYFHDRFCRESKKPLAIFILKKSNQLGDPVLSGMKGMALFQELDRNAYRGEYLGATDLKREHFNFFSQLANQVPSYELIRPANTDSHERITQLICKELSKLQDV